MRFLVCGVSALALAGCSWFGGGSHSGYSKSGSYGSGGYYSAQSQTGAGAGQCVVYSPAQPVPPGCSPSQVTLAQSAQYGYSGGQTTYATGGYGSHAGEAGQHASYRSGKPKLRKPKLRGSLSMGFEKSNSGTFLDLSAIDGQPAIADYNPADYAEYVSSGDDTVYEYTGRNPYLDARTFSYDDIYSTPFQVEAGLEYIVSPHATVYANAGYAYAEGETAGIGIEADLTRQEFDVNTGLSTGPGIEYPNENVSNINFDFSDMHRYDLELGGRYYFDPVVKNYGQATLTPFVSASGGASYYDGVSAKISQDHLFMADAFESELQEIAYYQVDGPTTFVDVYDSQWVPTGTLMAGMEWQVTPKTALALETGIRYEGAREFAGGADGDDNISIPVTLRGSFNF